MVRVGEGPEWLQGDACCPDAGALVSGSDFEGASMSGVNMLFVNGRYTNLQKTLQHTVNFR